MWRLTSNIIIWKAEIRGSLKQTEPPNWGKFWVQQETLPPFKKYRAIKEDTQCPPLASIYLHVHSSTCMHPHVFTHMHTPMHLSIQKSGGNNTTQIEVVNSVYRWCFRGGVVRMSLCDVIGSFKKKSV